MNVLGKQSPYSPKPPKLAFGSNKSHFIFSKKLKIAARRETAYLSSTFICPLFSLLLKVFLAVTLLISISLYFCYTVLSTV